MDQETKNIRVKFNGPALHEGRIDIFDFSKSVTALSELLFLISKETASAKGRALKIDLVALKQGSFDVNLTITLKDLIDYAPAVAPLLSDVNIISSVKQLIETLKSLIEVKKFLRGEKPSNIKIIQNDGAPHITVQGNKGQVNISVNTYNLLQNKKTSKKLHQLVQPLLRDQSEVDEIIIDGKDLPDSKILKEDAPYFENEDELQTVQQRIIGIVTAMDRKTSNGKVSVGEKRINFDVEIEDIRQLDKVVDGLIESMKHKVPILLIGDAAFDLEGNLKHIKVVDIEMSQGLPGF